MGKGWLVCLRHKWSTNCAQYLVMFPGALERKGRKGVGDLSEAPKALYQRAARFRIVGPSADFVSTLRVSSMRIHHCLYLHSS